ncbi:hypothetical protein [Terriglobus sp.]|uniref:hypothetical protein n=1 Tax=Terriglobus sp. TaxID=1889013 RepID=UPI003AFFD1D1
MIHPARQLGVLAVGIALAAPGTLPAQASLPATAPTSITPSQLPSANPAVPRGQASIRWDGHLLQITASGESLGQVLREVAARAGIHITGNTPDDRIFGTYGPAPLVDVLSDLVGGLPVNMLFVERTSGKPAQLTFTARNGGPTPPGIPLQQDQVAQQPTPPPPSYPATPPQQPAPSAISSGAEPVGGIPVGAAQPANPSATTNPASPNGVKTPQEIFEQLQRLRATSGAPR